MKTIVEGHDTRIETRWRSTAAILFAAALLSAPVLAQRHAQPRSGSSGGGGGASARHAPSGGSGGHSASRPSASRSSGPSSSVHRDGSFGRSAPHRPTGSVRHDGGSHHGGHYPYYRHRYYPSFSFGFGYYSPFYYGYSPYYSPYYYSPYYSYYPYSYGYGSYGYGRPYGYYPHDYHRGGYGSSYYDRQDLGAVALKVRPKTAEVYIDGRYVGTAGSFDGFPSYLWLEPGTYRLELVQDGYENLEREIDVSPSQVLEFKLRLDEGIASRPEVRSDRDYDRGDRDYRRDYDRRDYDRDDRRGYGRDDRRDYLPPRRGDLERGREIPRDARRDGAELVLEVEPEDASVYVDGQFVGTAAEVSRSTDPLVVDAGEHVVQVVHPDFETEERSITVRAGEERLVEVSLRHDRRD